MVEHKTRQSDDLDILEAINNLDNDLATEEPNTDNELLKKPATLLGQEIYLDKIATVIVMPDVVWIATFNSDDNLNVTAIPYCAIFGISDDQESTNYYWPAFNDKGLLAYAIFREGRSKLSVFKHWSAYLASGALLYFINVTDNQDAFLNVMFPGCGDDQQSIIDQINQISISGEVASFYPLLARSGNGEPEHIIAKLSSVETGQLAFLSKHYVAASGEDNSIILVSDIKDMDAFFPWIEYQLIGSEVTFQLEQSMSSDDQLKLIKAVEKSDSNIIFNDCFVSISPKNTEEKWLRLLAENSVHGDNNAK